MDWTRTGEARAAGTVATAVTHARSPSVVRQTLAHTKSLPKRTRIGRFHFRTYRQSLIAFVYFNIRIIEWND